MKPLKHVGSQERWRIGFALLWTLTLTGCPPYFVHFHPDPVVNAGTFVFNVRDGTEVVARNDVVTLRLTGLAYQYGDGYLGVRVEFTEVRKRPVEIRTDDLWVTDDEGHRFPIYALQLQLTSGSYLTAYRG